MTVHKLLNEGLRLPSGCEPGAYHARHAGDQKGTMSVHPSLGKWRRRTDELVAAPVPGKALAVHAHLGLAPTHECKQNTNISLVP